MQKRTYDINLSEDYCPAWTATDGIRELLQNFFDGLCSSTSGPTSIDQVRFAFKEEGKESGSRWLKQWRALHMNSDHQEREIGRVTWNMKSDTFVILNKNVTLSADKVLKLGPTSKRNKQAIGGHGEGLKVGVLSILREGFNIKFRTNGDLWHWSLKKSRLSDVPTLHCVTTESKKATDLEIVISEISGAELDVDDYLYLSSSLLPVNQSRCDEGFLLECSDESCISCGHERIYVKGIFVSTEKSLNVPLNLQKAKVHRDRKLIADRNYLIRCVSQIWTTVLRSEAGQLAFRRKYTSKFLRICQEKETSLEHMALEHMEIEAGAALLKYIRQTNSCHAFPYIKGTPGATEVITSVLKKVPYSCSELLFDLLQENSDVLTIEEAQRKSFDESEPASAEVSLLPMSRLLTRFVDAASSASVTVSFRTGNTLSVFRKENVLLVSSSMVEGVGIPDLKEAVSALKMCERELRKGKQPSQVEKLEMNASMFVASRTFRSFVPEIQANNTCAETEANNSVAAGNFHVAQKTTNDEVQGEKDDHNTASAPEVNCELRIGCNSEENENLAEERENGNEATVNGNGVECGADGIEDNRTGTPTSDTERRSRGVRRSVSRSPNQRPRKVARLKQVREDEEKEGESLERIYDRTTIILNGTSVEVIHAVPSGAELVEKGTIAPSEMETEMEDGRIVSNTTVDLGGTERGNGFRVVRKDGEKVCFRVWVHSQSE